MSSLASMFLGVFCTFGRVYPRAPDDNPAPSSKSPLKILIPLKPTPIKRMTYTKRRLISNPYDSINRFTIYESLYVVETDDELNDQWFNEMKEISLRKEALLQNQLEVAAENQRLMQEMIAEQTSSTRRPRRQLKPLMRRCERSKQKLRRSSTRSRARLRLFCLTRANSKLTRRTIRV
ncbi:unnamed protein product [Trichogramma brassicae]|uniref:PH domain-containing protein n=1 Tax=Trichogramma brassicae TaxID=86971 RepID=A0A6H5HXY2_9HYME|nr:unnamed protein product [Trichogramma brassicae]